MPDSAATGRQRWQMVTVLSLFIASAAIIGYQLSLMRALSVLRYYHFAYLVIGIALLGFGASGTILAMRYEYFVKRIRSLLPVLLVAFSVSIPTAYLLGNAVPLDVQYLLYSGKQIGLLVLYVICVLVPFLLGASVVGLLLAEPGAQAGLLYGANLAGSGLGGIGTLLLMHVVEPSVLPLRVGLVAAVAAVVFLIAAPKGSSRALGWKLALGAVAVGVAIGTFAVPEPEQIDQYKTLAHMKRLQAQGDAQRLAVRYGPHGRVDVYEAPSVHRTLFAAIQGDVIPPPQLSMLIDGEATTSVFRIQDAGRAAIMDYTPQSLPHRVTSNPRVLLLGATGGSSVWLARRFDASAVHVVQPNPEIVELMTGTLADQTGGVFTRRTATVHVQDSRSFVEQDHEPFDIIHLVASEGMPTASGGLASLHEDYLLTVESFSRMLTLLSPSGFLAVTRGKQSPPRDNIRIFNTAVSALTAFGARDPGAHLFQASNYLAVTTLLSARPLGEDRANALAHEAKALQMTVEHGPAPVGSDSDSYYARAARQILSPARRGFESRWMYRILPSTDEQPYFHNFFRWRSLPEFVRTYGNLWLTRLELGYVVVVITLLVVAALAIPLTVLPVRALRRSGARAPHVRMTVLHFAAIGLGFFFVEMVFIQKFTRILGDPVISASAVLTSLLLAAGLGSYTQSVLRWKPIQRIRAGAIGVVAISVTYVVGFDVLFSVLINASQAARYAAVLAATAPPAFFMGWLFPAGLDRCREFAPALSSLAWGVNGFFSVIATPLAVLLAMEFGFSWVIAAAVAAYAGVFLLSYVRMPAP